jgi:uncharacterized membrane protein (UPF0127 family)
MIIVKEIQFMDKKIFEYYEGEKKKEINAQICKSFFSKAFGLMFKKNSPPLLFVFDKEKTLSIHSFFCKPFIAIWLDKNKKVTKKVLVKNWKFSIFGKGKYLLEIPLKNKDLYTQKI